MNHHPGHPKYKTATKAEYEAFYKRIEEHFNPEDMSTNRLASWLQNENLADQFSLTQNIYLQAQRSNSIDELRNLRGDAEELVIHRQKVLDLIDEKIDELQVQEQEGKIAKDFARATQLAKDKGFTLNANTIYAIYDKWGRYKKEAIVIRHRGKIKTWRYV